MAKVLPFKKLLSEQLDDSLEPWRATATTQPPASGWARALREALGMSAEQLAKRIGVTRATVATLERSEARGTITLASLQKLARGLGCRVTYALVPADGESIADLRRKRALELARAQLARVQHTMNLEAQGLTPERERRQIERLADELLARSPRKLWE